MSDIEGHVQFGNLFDQARLPSIVSTSLITSNETFDLLS